MKRLAAFLLGLALVAALASPAALAKGKLDPSFGDGGRALLATALSGTDYTRDGSVAEAPDGHVYAVVGERAVFGLLPDGRVDQGFGTGGAIDPFPPGELVHGPVGVAVDPLGRILVAATAMPIEPAPPPPAESEPPEPVPEPQQAIVVARFTPAGQPDPTFGNGGLLMTRLGFPPPQIPPGPVFGTDKARRARVDAAGIAVDPAGRIVLSGTYLAGYEICPDGHPSSSHREAFLARLGDDGKPDPSFGQNGVSTLRQGPVGPPALDDRGGVYASVGTPMPSCAGAPRESRGYLFHLDSAGIPVGSFGAGGWRPIPEDTSVKLLPDARGGLILMPGSVQWRSKLVLRRLRANGSWDRSFGRASVAEPFPAPRGTLIFTDAALGGGGQIYVAGSWKRRSRPDGAKRRFLLFRLDRRGRLDRRYGVLRTGFGQGTTALSLSLLIAPSGGPLVIGPFRDPRAGYEGLALARYLP
ncbi:MAG TPA: hypothetical protein VEP91_00345 [Solirubrobacterales bacterium]|nr:hypothetical protein [Solirubrobacterales bacterium]